MITPSIPAGFERQNFQYTITSDGLSLAYSFQDVEKYKLVPQPASGATRFEGKFSVNTTNGVQAFQECSVTVWGKKTAKKADLLGIATNICLQRLIGKIGLATTANTFFAGGYMADSMHENKVEIRIRQMIQRKPGDTYYGLCTAFNKNADTIWQNNTVPPDPGTRGTAMLKLIGPMLGDPCAGSTSNPQDQGGPNAAAGQNTAANVTVVNGGLPQNGTNDLNAADVQQGMYTDYSQNISYSIDYNTLHMPIVGSTLSSFATVAKPKVTKTVIWAAEKWGVQPTMPDPKPGPNEVLLNKEIFPHTPALAPDATTPIYRVTGRYIYAIKDSSKLTSFGFGQMPMLTAAAADASVKQSKFMTGLISNQ